MACVWSLAKFFSIVLHGIFFYSLSFIYLYQHKFMYIPIIVWFIIQCSTLLLEFFQLWLLRIFFSWLLCPFGMLSSFCVYVF